MKILLKGELPVHDNALPNGSAKNTPKPIWKYGTLITKGSSWLWKEDIAIA
jgi:hypothetical protein